MGLPHPMDGGRQVLTQCLKYLQLSPPAGGGGGQQNKGHLQI